MNLIKYFLAGFLSTLIFHQGLLYLLHLAQIAPVAAYSMKPTPPMGVPSVISLAFFGGLWGIALGKLLSVTTDHRYWLKSFAFGAFMPTLFAIGVVFPIKGIEITPIRILLGLILNGAWGLGTSGMLFLTAKYPVIKKEKFSGI